MVSTIKIKSSLKIWEIENFSPTNLVKSTNQTKLDELFKTLEAFETTIENIKRSLLNNEEAEEEKNILETFYEDSPNTLVNSIRDIGSSKEYFKREDYEIGQSQVCVIFFRARHCFLIYCLII